MTVVRVDELHHRDVIVDIEGVQPGARDAPCGTVETVGPRANGQYRVRYRGGSYVDLPPGWLVMVRRDRL